jgi:hypothetical protein
LTLFPTDDLTAPAATQRWPRSLAGLAVVALAVAGGFWWLDSRPTSGQPPYLSSPTGPGQSQVLTPSAGSSAAAIGLPSPDAAAGEPLEPSTTTPPSASWSGSDPATAPSAPFGLAVRGSTSSSINLSWQPPADPGSGQIIYYRVFRDGVDSGWTPNHRVSVVSLAPGMRYSFNIVAYNAAGLASPLSEAAVGTTAAAPASSAPPAPSPTVSISPRPGIRLGDSFAVVGANWPCKAPATIRILLGAQAVAIADLDSAGAFTVNIAVDATNPDAPHAQALGSGEPIMLMKGLWQVTAELASQPYCGVSLSLTTQANFR